jgi:thiol-disulfide isomerase/thioredoxin
MSIIGGKMTKNLLVLVLLFKNAFTLEAQLRISRSDSPKVGSLCPNFILKDVQYYSKKELSLNEFKGKWLFLDFWNEYCSSCITSFSETNELQNKFTAEVQFILIGYTGSQYDPKRRSYKTIRSLYERVRQKEHLSLPVAFDSLLFHRFKITGCPHIIVIDPMGIIRGITYSLNAANISDFLSGKQPKLPKVYDQNEELKNSYDPKAPFLTNGNGGNDTDFLFRSLFSEWNPSIPSYNPVTIDNTNEGRFEVLKLSLTDLYRFAYTGKPFWNMDDSLYGNFYPDVLLEINDSSVFQANYATGKNLYCYSLTVPAIKLNKINLMEIMQNDLKNYFGFFATIETRIMPYWRLVASEKAKQQLRTSSDSVYFRYVPNMGFSAKNYPIRSLIRMIWSGNQSEPPFIDDTGISDNIDITLDCLMTNLKDIKRALNDNGLDLIRGEKEMKVIVIKD